MTPDRATAQAGLLNAKNIELPHLSSSLATSNGKPAYTQAVRPVKKNNHRIHVVNYKFSLKRKKNKNLTVIPVTIALSFQTF